MDEDKIPNVDDDINTEEITGTQSDDDLNITSEENEIDTEVREELNGSEININVNIENKIVIKPKNSLAKEILGWVVTILIAFIIAALIRAFVFDHAVVDGRSMENTLQDKQHLIVYKFGYLFHAPQKGDIIMFEYQKGLFKYLPFPDPKEIDYIKRVVAIPGDKVDLIDGSVYVNEKKVSEPFAKGRTDIKGAELPYPFIVPANNVFALGDNRENSSDSRQIGLIGFDRIKGKAIFRIYPFNEVGTVK